MRSDFFNSIVSVYRHYPDPIRQAPVSESVVDLVYQVISAYRSGEHYEILHLVCCCDDMDESDRSDLIRFINEILIPSPN